MTLYGNMSILQEAWEQLVHAGVQEVCCTDELSCGEGIKPKGGNKSVQTSQPHIVVDSLIHCTNIFF